MQTLCLPLLSYLSQTGTLGTPSFERPPSPTHACAAGATHARPARPAMGALWDLPTHGAENDAKVFLAVVLHLECGPWVRVHRGGAVRSEQVLCVEDDGARECSGALVKILIPLFHICTSLKPNKPTKVEEPYGLLRGTL